jgi:hypothetical protein
MNKRTIIIAALILICMSINGQVKYEQESRVKMSDVPRSACEWLNDAFEGRKKVKWYYETTLTSNSYEAKFTWENYNYSVKFDTTGHIIDIEKAIEFDEIPEQARNNILLYFEENFQRHRLIKIQEQATGDEDDLEDMIDENEVEGITIRYEIEFHGVTATDNKLWEALFGSFGEFVMQQEIVLHPNFNLDF